MKPRSNLFTLMIVAASLMAWCINARASCSSSGFAAAPSINALDLPRSPVTGDFNGDGKPDLVVANDSSNKVSVMLGDGAGSFSSINSFATGRFPISVAIGDLNNDFKTDIVTVNAQSNDISILLGDGAGGFASAVNLPLAPYNYGYVVVSDFNNDTNQDLAIAISGDASDIPVLVMLGDGSGNFGTPAKFPVGGRLVSMTQGDFNIDGNLDLAVVRQFGGEVWVLPGDGKGNFGSPQGFSVGVETTYVAAGDFNNDGKPDLAVSLYASKMMILLNKGDGTFASPTQYTVLGSNLASIAIADFNNDGKNDWAVGQNTGVSVRFGDGAGGFGAEAIYSAGLGPIHLAVNDFNGDGSSDLALASYSSSSIELLLNKGTGAFIVAPRYPTGSGPNSVITGDFNSDGKLDLAVANRNSNDVSILLGNGTGSFEAAKNFSVGLPPTTNISNQPVSLAKGDFNGDGKIDLVTANFTGSGVSILLGDGAGNFPSATKINVGSWYPWFVAVADFNKDGKADLALTRNGYFNTISILYGNGDGTFGAPVDFATQTLPRYIAVGDFNGDANPDLAVGSTSGNQVSILLNNGAGGFSPPTSYTTDINAGNFSIATGDFTGDGKVDLVVANNFKKTLSLLTGNGAGAFSSPQFFNLGASPNGLTTADFNGDGLPDVAVTYESSSNVSILQGNGTGGFSTPKSYSAGVVSSSITAGDFNGDGKPDLATDGISVLLNTCADALGAPLPSISINDISLSEHDASAVFNAVLSAPSAQPVTVQYYTSSQSAVSGADFQAVSGTLTFAPGETEKTIAIPLIDDLINEFTENFKLNLYQPANGTIKKRQGTAKLTDDDPEPSVSIQDVSLKEGNSGTALANFLVTLSSPSGKLITLTYSTSDATALSGSDYQAASARVLSIPAGASSAAISITINSDLSFEPDEDFFITLTNPVNATLADAQAKGTILNDDTPTLQLSASGYTVEEAGGNATIVVKRTGDTTNSSSVDYATSDTAGLADCSQANTGVSSSRCDYTTTTGTLQFAAGESTKNILIPVGNDNIFEGNENFTITLSNPSGAILGSIQTATITIIDNDPLTPPLYLILDESGVAANQAAALDSMLFLRDPFPVINEATWWNQGADKNTRVIVFVTNLQLASGETPSSVIVNLIDGSSQSYDVAAEDVRIVPGFNFTQVIFRLPDNLSPGTCVVKVKAHSQESNSGTIRIKS